jgi:hypothetical protein
MATQLKRAGSPLAHARVRKPPARFGDELEGPQHQTKAQGLGPNPASGGEAARSIVAEDSKLFVSTWFNETPGRRTKGHKGK